MAKIAIVGSLNVDMTAYSTRFVRDGETLTGNELKIGPGGKGNNQACAAARAGGEVCMISKMGKDFLGKVITENLDKEGISDKYISVSENCATGSAIIEVSAESGQNRIVVIPGANAELSANDVKAAEDEIKKCDVFLTQLETKLEPIIEGINIAKNYQKTVILNPAPLRDLPREILEKVDYFTPNETEAEFYSGVKIENDSDAERAAEEIIKLGVKNVIITLGKRGVFYTNGKEKCIVPTKTVKALDTTGAGDSFNGALAVAIGENFEIKEALKFANCAGSISVTRYGAARSCAYRNEIDQMMSDFYNITK